jgi:uncharacterized protein
MERNIVTSLHARTALYLCIISLYAVAYLSLQSVIVFPAVALNNNDGEDTRRIVGIYSGPIIDVHLHSYTDDDFWGPVPNPVNGRLSVGSAQEHMERSIEIMREYNIVLGAVSGESKGSADMWRSHAPDMILRGITLAKPADFFDPASFRTLVETGEIDVLGEVAAQYVGLSPSDEDYSPYWEIAKEYGIPVGIHTGQSFPGTPHGCCPEFRLRYGNPLLLEDMLVEFPSLKVYMMHAGGGEPFSEYALMMMTMYPQLYADIGVLSWLPELAQVLESFLRRAKERGLLDRVMFGSDQMVWPEAIGMAVDRINGYDFLTVEEKADIFYNNASRFLGLDEEVITRHHAGYIEPATK